jgi:hypothetical protein
MGCQMCFKYMIDRWKVGSCGLCSIELLLMVNTNAGKEYADVPLNCRFHSEPSMATGQPTPTKGNTF